MEDDSIVIELPSGYTLDNPEQPAPFRSANVADYNVKISVVGKSEALQYKRTFSFNGLVFPSTSYTPLKQLFDMLHESDNHTITLKQATTTQ
jgi:hypothetical protein